MKKKKRKGRGVFGCGFFGVVFGFGVFFPPFSVNQSICDSCRMNLKLKKRHRYMTKSTY